MTRGHADSERIENIIIVVGSKPQRFVQRGRAELRGIKSVLSSLFVVISCRRNIILIVKVSKLKVAANLTSLAGLANRLEDKWIIVIIINHRFCLWVHLADEVFYRGINLNSIRGERISGA